MWGSSLGRVAIDWGKMTGYLLPPHAIYAVKSAVNEYCGILSESRQSAIGDEVAR